MSDQPAAEAATYTTDAHPSPQRDPKPRPLQQTSFKARP